jgi:hypothetical protein
MRMVVREGRLDSSLRHAVTEDLPFCGPFAWKGQTHVTFYHRIIQTI